MYMFIDHNKNNVKTMPTDFKAPAQPQILSAPIPSGAYDPAALMDKINLEVPQNTPFVSFYADNESMDVEDDDSLLERLNKHVSQSLSMHAYVGALTITGLYIVYKMMRIPK